MKPENHTVQLVCFGVAALICGLVWASLSLYGKLKGDRHQRKARAAAAAGDWEQAALSYKLAILERLDAEPKLRELVKELSEVYASRGLGCDLSPVLECPRILKEMEPGSGGTKKMNEDIKTLYKAMGAFLDRLPGPALPDK